MCIEFNVNVNLFFYSFSNIYILFLLGCTIIYMAEDCGDV